MELIVMSGALAVVVLVVDFLGGAIALRRAAVPPTRTFAPPAREVPSPPVSLRRPPRGVDSLDEAA